MKTFPSTPPPRLLLPPHVRITTIDDNNYRPRTSRHINFLPPTASPRPRQRRGEIGNHTTRLPDGCNGEKLPIALLMTVISIHGLPVLRGPGAGYLARTAPTAINLIGVNE